VLEWSTSRASSCGVLAIHLHHFEPREQTSQTEARREFQTGRSLRQGQISVVTLPNPRCYIEQARSCYAEQARSRYVEQARSRYVERARYHVNAHDLSRKRTYGVSLIILFWFRSLSMIWTRPSGGRGFCRKKIVAVDQFHLCGTAAIVGSGHPTLLTSGHYRSPAEYDTRWRSPGDSGRIRSAFIGLRAWARHMVDGTQAWSSVTWMMRLKKAEGRCRGR
jgi:hypothetical protein